MSFILQKKVQQNTSSDWIIRNIYVKYIVCLASMWSEFFINICISRNGPYLQEIGSFFETRSVQ